MDIQEYREGRMSDNLKKIYTVKSYFFGIVVRSKKKIGYGFPHIASKLQTNFLIFIRLCKG